MHAFFHPYFESDYIILIKPRNFNISIDYTSLNIFSSSQAHVPQITQGINIFRKCCK